MKLLATFMDADGEIVYVRQTGNHCRIRIAMTAPWVDFDHEDLPDIARELLVASGLDGEQVLEAIRLLTPAETHT